MDLILTATPMDLDIDNPDATNPKPTYEVAIHLSCSKPVAKGYCAYFEDAPSTSDTVLTTGVNKTSKKSSSKVRSFYY